MATTHVIIGAGPAGEAAAVTLHKLAKLRALDLTIVLVEREQAGGLCLNKGCIPSKTLLESVHKKVAAGQPIDWNELQKFKTAVVSGLRAQLDAKFKALKIQRVQGEARFTGPQEITVKTAEGDRVLPFDKAIIATGTSIYYPAPLLPVQNDVLNSDSALNLTAAPPSVIVVGGGAVGCEFACLLNAAGSRVTIVEMKENLLPGEDAAVAQALRTSFEARGIVVKTGTVVKDARKSAAGWDVTLSTGELLQTQQVLACVGRLPDTGRLALETAGIQSEKGRIITNEFFQTSNAHVFAAGDVAGSRLAHHAAAQGEAAAANALGGREKCDDRFVPRCLYSWPEVASVGAWKYQLEEKNVPVKATRAFFKGSSKALAANDTEGFVQIVTDSSTGKIEGAQIIGAHATELIHIFSVALKAEMTVTQLSEVMFAHPTLSELIRDAARR